VISLALWVMLEYLPIGRYIYVVGANPEAAKLNGIPTRKYIVLAFVLSGMIVAFAGVILASQLRIGQTSLGDSYLLPALVGAFLGSTTLKPGRVNVWGTLIAVAVLAIGITGLQQLGAEFYVEPMFNGLTLLIAIGLAGLTGRRRVQMQRAREIAQHSSTSTSTPSPPDKSSS
jgi:ribose transport system permease protein